MATQIINANTLLELTKDLYSETIKFTKENSNIKRNPKLIIITATNDQASHRYVKNKLDLAKDFGIEAIQIKLEESVTQEEVEKTIDKLNKDKTVDGIILQLPIYEHLNENLLLNSIDIDKDVDGLTIASKGMLEDNAFSYMPCTPLGVQMLLESYDIDCETEFAGKNVVVIGRGQTAGAPMSVMFRHLDANVTVLHSKTSKIDLEAYVRNADVVISCVGKRHLLKADWFKEGSIVIGVGFTYDENGKQHLDFEVDNVVNLNKARLVTNRVNCTGKATVIGLMANTVLAYSINLS